jgi:hypothetical protein
MGNARKGFEMVAKGIRKSVMADAVQVYWENGYNQWQDFPGEYFFLFNRQTCEKVRLYYRISKVVENRRSTKNQPPIIA